MYINARLFVLLRIRQREETCRLPPLPRRNPYEICTCHVFSFLHKSSLVRYYGTLVLVIYGTVYTIKLGDCSISCLWWVNWKNGIPTLFEHSKKYIFKRRQRTSLKILFLVKTFFFQTNSLKFHWRDPTSYSEKRHCLIAKYSNNSIESKIL